MNTEAIRGAVLRQLGNIAPEADLDRLNTSADLREELDIDSMDRLNFLSALSREFQIEIPERDYPQLVSLEDCIRYLQKSSSASSA